MRIKYVIALHLIVPILMIWAVCNAEAIGKCVKNAERWYHYHMSKGTDARIYSGWYDGRPHRWCEYWDGEKWVMARDTNSINDGWVRPNNYRIRRRIK